MTFPTLDDVKLAGKRVLVRVDLNVPMERGRVTDATRLRAVVPTIREIADKGARVLLLAHFGRPKGRRDPDQSLLPVVEPLAEALGKPVAFGEDCIGPAVEEALELMAPGDVILLENTRFHPGEEANDPDFAAALAEHGDIYVNVAFSAAHRAHASTEGITHVLPAYAGRAMAAELVALQRALGRPNHPVVAIVGGAKVSTKLELLGALTLKVDTLVIGGGMANTFLAAQGIDIGRSLCERTMLDTAASILRQARSGGCEIILPVDAVVATEFAANAQHRTVPVGEVGPDEMILDIGPETVAAVTGTLKGARTLVWNGPVGAFETEPFDAGTTAIARVAAERTAEGGLMSVAGGGDTVAALNNAGVAEAFSYVSTAGGAFLEWMEGKALPGVDALRHKANAT